MLSVLNITHFKLWNPTVYEVWAWFEVEFGVSIQSDLMCLYGFG